MLDALAEPPAVISRAEARAAGLRYYFTGKPCKYGHVALRRVDLAVCRECMRLKALVRYYADLEASRARSREYADRYREKRSATARARRLTDGEAIRARDRELRALRREEVNALARARRDRAPEAYLAYARRWRAENAERVAEAKRANREKNAEAIREYRRRYRKEKPEIERKNRHNRRAAEGEFTDAEYKRILRDQRGRCAYCRVDIRKSHHIDHIIAVSRGGSNRASNIQLLCPPCNLRKHAKDPIDFARSLGKLL